jgi:mutual gliding-motility protein MglA
MAVFNYLRKEIDAKIVYYGPGLCGKTTNLQFIHQHLKPEQRGKMVSLATDEDRTLFFDFLPIELESVRGFKTRFHLYTVPGQVYYGATRRAVLTGADGVVFVADSQAERVEDNLFSLKDLEDNLRYYGKKLESTPLIIQYNKRDLANILPVEELNQKINRLHVPSSESIAIQGKGVFETLTMTCRIVLKAIEMGIETRRSTPSTAASPESGVEKATWTEKAVPRKDPAPAPPGVSSQRPVGFIREVPPVDGPRTSAEPAPAKPFRLGKESPRPEAPGSSPISPEVKTSKGPLRIGRDVPMTEGVRAGSPLARALRLEKDVSPSGSAPVTPEGAMAKALQSPKEAPLAETGITGSNGRPGGGGLSPKESKSPESIQTGKIPRVGIPKIEEDKKKPEQRSFLNRVFEKKKAEAISKEELAPKGEEEPVKKNPVAKESLRIIECGQPHISSPNGLEIPLTVKIDGLSKSLSFKLSINLESVEPKID